MTRYLMLVGVLLATASCVGNSPNLGGPTAYQFSRRGDDGVTLRIADAILSELSDAQDFRDGGDGKGRKLLVEIPDHASASGLTAKFDLVLRWSDYSTHKSYHLSCQIDLAGNCGRTAIATIKKYISEARKGGL